MKPSRAKIAIVGGGAGGLLASLWLGESKSVEIFEQNSSVGKKLLATGNGRCNITHVSASERASETILANPPPLPKRR